FGDERLEHIDALLPGLGERSETCEPDLIGRFPDFHSEVSCLRKDLVFRRFSGKFLQSLRHDHSRLGGQPAFLSRASKHRILEFAAQSSSDTRMLSQSDRRTSTDSATDAFSLKPQSGASVSFVVPVVQRVSPKARIGA